jgi:hypothetical protein
MKLTSISGISSGFIHLLHLRKLFGGFPFHAPSHSRCESMDRFHFWSKLCRTTTIKFCEKLFEKKVKYKTIKLNNTFETSDSMDLELLLIRFHKVDPSGFLIGSEELKYFSANRPFSMIKV